MDETRQLVTAAARGDRDAFASLFLQYRQLVYRVAYKITLNGDDALDVTQDVFTRLVTKLDGFTGRGSFASWIAAIATNEALTHLRRPHRREQATDPAMLIELRTAPAIAQRKAEQHEQRELVEAAMRELSPQQRAILLLQRNEDIGPAEVARRLTLPASHVRVQLRRAILSLREVIFSKAKAGRNK